MPIRRNPDSGRVAVQWLATAVVLLLGAVACILIILAAAESPSREIMYLASFLGAFSLVLFLFSLKRDEQTGRSWLGMWLRSHHKTDPNDVLRIGRRKPDPIEYGTNSPPTIESVREAKEQIGTWVPSGSSSQR